MHLGINAVTNLSPIFHLPYSIIENRLIMLHINTISRCHDGDSGDMDIHMVTLTVTRSVTYNGDSSSVVVTPRLTSSGQSQREPQTDNFIQNSRRGKRDPAGGRAVRASTYKNALRIRGTWTPFPLHPLFYRAIHKHNHF